MRGTPTNHSWSGSIAKALATLAIAALVLFVVESVFFRALPALLVLLALVGIYRLALGLRKGNGW